MPPNPKSKLKERQQPLLTIKYPLSFFCYLENNLYLQLSLYQTECNPRDKFLSTPGSPILNRSNLFMKDLVIEILNYFCPEPWHSLSLNSIMSIPLAHTRATAGNKAKIGAWCGAHLPLWPLLHPILTHTFSDTKANLNFRLIFISKSNWTNTEIWTRTLASLGHNCSPRAFTGRGK